MGSAATGSRTIPIAGGGSGGDAAGATSATGSDAGGATFGSIETLTVDGAATGVASGCGALVMHPYLQGRSEHPRAVLGLFDPSARPYAAPDVLGFAVPIARFERMAANMEESFLITPTWDAMRKRIKG
jgi:hypothetical protein